MNAYADMPPRGSLSRDIDHCEATADGVQRRVLDIAQQTCGRHEGVPDGLDLLEPVRLDDAFECRDERLDSWTTCSGGFRSQYSVNPTMSQNKTATLSCRLGWGRSADLNSLTTERRQDAVQKLIDESLFNLQLPDEESFLVAQPLCDPALPRRVRAAVPR